MVLWTEKEILSAVKGSYCNNRIPDIMGVSIDSRTTQRGDLFIALRGENFDGHNFIKQAINKGAYACLAEFIPEDVDADKNPIIIVDYIKDALESLAQYSRERTNAKIIGVTGSVGKTSVKDAIAFVLSTTGKTYATQGNFNNDIGLPLSLCRMEADSKYGVFELGMNHAGEILYLSNLLKPDIALITNVEAVHIEFFDSEEDIVAAKCEIFDGLTKNGIAIIPTGKHERQIRKYCFDRDIKNIVSFGKTIGCDYYLDNYSSDKGKNKITVQVKSRKQKFDYILGINGIYQAVNSLAVLAVIDSLGLDIIKIKDEFVNLQPGDGRGKIHKISNGKIHYTLIDDSYNASPVSIKASLENLGKYEGRKIAVLGDMLELGEQSEKFHCELANDIEKNKIDKVIAVGKLMENLYKELPAKTKGKYFESYEKVEEFLAEYLQESDIVLLKGSHGSNIWKIVKNLTNIYVVDK